MRIIDLSQPVYDGCPNCPTHPLPRSTRIADHPTDGWRMEQLSLASHTGSHLDAPLHKLADTRKIDDYPLGAFVAPAVVVDLRDAGADRAITAELLAERARGATLADCAVLLATGYGDRRARTDDWFYHAPFLAPSGARYLVDQRVRGIGIDHYSLGGARDPDNSTTHEIVLGANVWILEELRFPPEVFGLKAKPTLWALPINLKEHSGAPCRPVLVVTE